ncbi:hypothetical protein MRX96_016227 [Rhipicephalus microplus]
MVFPKNCVELPLAYVSNNKRRKGGRWREEKALAAPPGGIRERKKRRDGERAFPRSQRGGGRLAVATVRLRRAVVVCIVRYGHIDVLHLGDAFYDAEEEVERKKTEITFGP